MKTLRLHFDLSDKQINSRHTACDVCGDPCTIGQLGCIVDDGCVYCWYCATEHISAPKKKAGVEMKSNMAADTITVEEAIEFLNWHNYNCSTCHKIAVLVESQANEIKTLRCCGTCERYEVEFEGCGKKQILVYRQQTCEEWEQMIIPNDNGARIGECKKWEEK